MGETIRLSQCYSLDHGIEVKDDDSFYSKIEMIATGMLSSQLSGTLGIQAILYNAWRNSWGAREFTKYPLDMCLRISHTFEECCVRVVKGEEKKTAVLNVKGLYSLVEKLDQTTSKDLKIFAGFDGIRWWDFIAVMDAKKAVLYIQNNVDPAKIVEYLLPFVPVDMARSIIATEIEKKNKARRR